MTTQTRLLVFLGLISLGDGLLIQAQERPVGPPSGQDAKAPPKLGSIRGRVIGTDTGAGLSKTSLMLMSSEPQGRERPLTVKTNAEGDYELKEVKPGPMKDDMIRLLSMAAIFVVGLIVPAASQQQPQQATGPLIAGVARQDGVIIPFGLYKNGNWSKFGPETCSDKPVAGNTAEAMAALRGMKQIPLAWFLWTEDREQPVVMKVSKPVTVQSHCCQQWGLATGPNTVFKANSFPFPKLGIALSKPFNVELMRPLDAAEAEAKSLVTFFSPHFDLFEDVALRAKQDNANGLELREVLNSFYGSSIGSPRQPVPLKLHSAFRSRNAVNGRTLFHLEVFKEYPAPSCPVVAYGSFWISKDPMGILTILDQHATSVGFFDCDWKGAGFFTPLGIVFAGNLIFVLGQSNGWENEGYVVLEVLNNKVRSVLQVEGGGC